MSTDDHKLFIVENGYIAIVDVRWKYLCDEQMLAIGLKGDFCCN